MVLKSTRRANPRGKKFTELFCRLLDSYKNKQWKEDGNARS